MLRTRGPRQVPEERFSQSTRDWRRATVAVPASRPASRASNTEPRPDTMSSRLIEQRCKRAAASTRSVLAGQQQFVTDRRQQAAERGVVARKCARDAHDNVELAREARQW